MFFLRILRYVLGFVIFTAEGGFSERFLNLCSQRGINLHNVRMNETTVTAEIQASKYKKLREIARLSGVRLTCRNKYGVIFSIRRHEDRAGLAVGAVFFLVFMCIASLFVWNVETVGSEKLSSQTILLAAKQAGIYSGAFSRNIDQFRAANDIIAALNGKLSWVSVNIKGSHAVIEVRDYTQRRDDETYSHPSNIIADFDGVLLSVEVHNGTKASYEGSGVKKGDLLISGIFENRDSSSIFMEARGIITATHSDICYAQGNAKRTVKRYLKQKTVTKLGFFGIKVPLGFFSRNGDYDEFEVIEALHFGKVCLPFYISKVTRAYYVQTDEVDSEKNITILFDEFTDAEYKKYKNTLILDKKIKVSETENIVSVKSENSCIDFMGVRQKISFDE